MNVLIVYAHPEAQSFNAAMRELAERTFEEQGHSVRVSDLYRMRFDPVSDRSNFTTTANAEYYKQQLEERHAVEHDGFAPDIKAEMEKLEWADLLVFQFPLWWFGLPAILKGWVDRVFALGFAYGGGRWYDRGMFRGKRALCALTTGGPASIYGPGGMNGHLDELLYPINHGMFYFCGFDALPPFTAYAPAHLDDSERALLLEQYRSYLLSLDRLEPLAYPSLDEAGLG